MNDPISAIVLSCLAGVCLINMHNMFTNSHKNKNIIKKQKVKKESKPIKTIYTTNEEVYLEDQENRPIWF
jgi:hypothetical protein